MVDFGQRRVEFAQAVDHRFLINAREAAARAFGNVLPVTQPAVDGPERLHVSRSADATAAMVSYDNHTLDLQDIVSILQHIDSILQHVEAVEAGMDDDAGDAGCTKTSPGSRSTISLAGTRRSERAIHRYFGFCSRGEPLERIGLSGVRRPWWDNRRRSCGNAVRCLFQHSFSEGTHHGATVKDFYSVLGISPGAPADLVKAAFRKKANQFHPDKNSSPDAPARFRFARAAYETLSDPARRKAYDDLRQRSLIDDPQATAVEIWSAYCSGVLVD
ncbi:MAG: J domain-containing protein [Casimicrobiaceae bacterium]